MPRPTIMACGLSEGRLSRLRFLCMRQGLLLRPVTADEYGQTLGALSGLKAPEACGQAEGGVPEELLVFCHMPGSAVDRFLQQARQQRVPPFALKAVLTPTNAQWTLPRLYQELTEERAAIAAGAPAHDAQEDAPC